MAKSAEAEGSSTLSEIADAVIFMGLLSKRLYVLNRNNPVNDGTGVVGNAHFCDRRRGIDRGVPVRLRSFPVPAAAAPVRPLTPPPAVHEAGVVRARAGRRRAGRAGGVMGPTGRGGAQRRRLDRSRLERPCPRTRSR